MALKMFNKTSQWFLTAFLCSTSTLCFAHADLMSAHQEGEMYQARRLATRPLLPLRENLQIETDKRVRMIETLLRYTADAHQNALEYLWKPTTEVRVPAVLVHMDIDQFADLYSSIDPSISENLRDYMEHYFDAQKAYVSASSVSRVCTAASPLNGLRSEWRKKGENIAGFLGEVLEAKPRAKKKLIDAFAAWTDAQITCIDSAAPQCPDLTAPLNAKAANGAYLKSIENAVEIANKLSDLSKF